MAKCPTCGKEVKNATKTWKMAGKPDKKGKRTQLTIALYNYVGQYNTQWQYLTMAAFLALIPVLVLFYVIEKRLVAGLAGGAVKG